MKLQKIELQNVLSIANATLNLDSGLNLLIGPNAGGKSNFLDAITQVLRSSFLRPNELRRSRSDVSDIHQVDLPNVALPRHRDYANQPQMAIVEFIVTQGDLDRVQSIIANKDQLLAARKNYGGGYHGDDVINQMQGLTLGQIISFQLNDLRLSNVSVR
jgi:predicted ATP-dependent endonuclease of OLD family